MTTQLKMAKSSQSLCIIEYVLAMLLGCQRLHDRALCQGGEETYSKIQMGMQ